MRHSKPRIGFDRGLRRLRSLDYTVYVLSNPVMASRLREALEESLARERYLFPPGHPNIEARFGRAD